MAPVKRLNRALIEGQWDMLLRLVMSLKQKDVTAFTVLDIIMGQWTRKQPFQVRASYRRSVTSALGGSYMWMQQLVLPSTKP
jgi:hypothetical protein